MFPATFGLGKIPVKRIRYQKFLSPVRGGGGVGNVSRHKRKQMVSRQYLVQRLFPFAQMKIGLVCRKHSLGPTLGKPVLCVF